MERQTSSENLFLSEISVKSEPGPPMTLGGAAAAQLRFIVWCKDCQHQVEPDPGEMAERYGTATTVLDWSERLVWFPLRQPSNRHGRVRDEAARPRLMLVKLMLAAPLPRILAPTRRGERNYVANSGNAGLAAVG